MVKLDNKKLEKIITEASAKLKETNAKNFCISSIVPNEWLIEEEKKWDKNLNKKTIKSEINELISEGLKKSGLRYNASDGQVRVTFNLNNYSFEISNEPKFIFGRYFKYATPLSQSRWVSRETGEKHYISIEEIIGEVIKKYSKCSNYSLHASGREDVDVENHAGRPFVMELADPKEEFSLENITKELEKDGRVQVKDLRIVKRGWVELVSTSHFDKTYVAEIEAEREFNEGDLKKIKSLEGKIIEQQTPNRVMHRRANLERKRKIIRMEIVNYSGKSARISVEVEAGTYIKELINGDEGRTKPSISELLGSKVECKKLIVKEIKDQFLDSVNI